MRIGHWMRDRCHRRGRTLIAVLALVGVAGAGAAWAGYSALAGPGRHFGHGGHRLGAKAMRLHAAFVVDRALTEVAATDEQRQRIDAIVQRAFQQHDALRAEHAQVHAELAALLTAENVDRARLEALRAQQLQRIEEASRTLTQTVADAAEVLTQEQRVKLAAWAEELHQ
jgi:protein CpxP